MRTRTVRATVTALAVGVLLLLLSAPAGAGTEDPLQDLPSRVDTSPDRMRFVRTGVVVGAVALIVVAGAVLTRSSDDR